MKSAQPSHLDHVRDDTAYAEILANWDAAFYAKFTAAIRPAQKEQRILDIGCGVGQVVATLTLEGFEAHGVDVSAPNIAKTHSFTDRCLLYDGGRLPYPDGYFHRVGALNVVEHVQDPEDFIREAVRVCALGGQVILSSPNFLRFFRLARLPPSDAWNTPKMAELAVTSSASSSDAHSARECSF